MSFLVLKRRKVLLNAQVLEDLSTQGTLYWFSLINAYLCKQIYVSIAIFGTIIISKSKSNIRDGGKVEKDTFIEFFKTLFSKSTGFEVPLHLKETSGFNDGLKEKSPFFLLVPILYSGKYFNVIYNYHTHIYMFLWFKFSSFHDITLVPIPVNWNRLLTVYEAWPSVYSVIQNSD